MKDDGHVVEQHVAYHASCRPRHATHDDGDPVGVFEGYGLLDTSDHEERQAQGVEDKPGVVDPAYMPAEANHEPQCCKSTNHVNVTSKSGIPLSLDKEEYEFVNRDEAVHAIDAYSYGLGAMDCFCEMVSAGLKTLAMSHPCDTREERDSYLQDAEKLCRKYGVKLYPEDEAFITDLFPEELNKGKYNYLFYRTGDVLERYMGLKEQQKRLIADHAYTGQERYRIAVEFGKLLSYPEEGIERLIERAGREKQ